MSEIAAALVTRADAYPQSYECARDYHQVPVSRPLSRTGLDDCCTSRIFIMTYGG